MEIVATNWEYLMRDLGGVAMCNIESELNKLGTEGWECITAVGGHFLFKRKIS